MSDSKVIVVSGANRGIGFEIAQRLANGGHRVFLTTRRREAGRKAVEALSGSPGQATFVPLDVTDRAGVQKAARLVGEAVDHVDVLINNAGIYPDGESTVLNVDEALLSKSFLTNTVGALLVSQAFLPLLTKSRHGRIINVSSGLGSLADMSAAAPSYSISKAGLNAVTRQLSAALKDRRISVNSVCPGWVRTDMGGSSAPRSVEEGAAGILWLALEAPQDLTGQFFRDGKEIPW